MSKPIYNFIIIDDDSCYNILSALSIKKIYKPININIVGFTNAKQGVEHIEKNVPYSLTKTVLFLDINMPHFNGWEVLKVIEKMPAATKNNLIIYMVSGVISDADRIKAFSFSCVKDCLEKPLSDHLLQIIEELAEHDLLQKMYA